MIKPALIALALLATPAFADVVLIPPTLTSNVTTIFVGQSITFNVVIPAADIPLLPQMPPNDTWGYAGGGGVFRSGDGQTQNSDIFIGGGGNVTFAYLTAGDYVASVSGGVFYHSVICDGSLGPGCYSLPNGGAGPYSQNFIATENITVLASVPEPSTWAILLLGFALLSVAAPSRRRLAR